MLYTDSRTTAVAISTGDHKRSALFFDKIIPTYSSGEVPTSLLSSVHFENTRFSEIFSSVSSCPRGEAHDVVQHFAERVVWQEAPMSVRYQPSYIEEKNRELPDVVKRAETMWADPEYMAQSILRYGRLDGNAILIPTFDTEEAEQKLFVPGDANIIEVTLTDLDIIDTTRLAWEQIVELKKDDDSKRKLRNLRLFLYTNYANQPISFIRDDLQRIIDEYHNACKKHGFRLVTGCVSSVIESKSLLATMALGTFALLSGIPITAITPGMVGEAVLEVGKVVINYLKEKRDISDYKENHHLAYILRLPLHGYNE